jgi:ATP-dependent helicase HrpB
VLLARLGALAEDGQITALGREMCRLPVHPRLSRMVLAAHARGFGAEACTMAALLGERDLRAGSQFNEQFGQSGQSRERAHGGDDQVGPSDVLLLLELFDEAQRARFDRDRLRRQGVDAGAALLVDRVRGQLARALGLREGRQGRQNRTRAAELPASAASAASAEEALLFAVLCGFPDRVAKRRGREGSAPSPEVVLCGGGSAVLSPRSAVKEAPLVVVVDAEERDAGPGPGRPGLSRGRGRVTVRLASAIEEDWLLELPLSTSFGLAEGTEVTWTAAAERVETTSWLRYDKLTLSESRTPEKAGDPAVERVLREAALFAGPDAFADGADGEGLDRLVRRLAFAATHLPDSGLLPPGDDTKRQALSDLCTGRKSFAELRAASLLDAVRARCGLSGPDGPARERLLREVAPEHVVLPGGRRVRVEYSASQDQPPFIASRLQDFFGMAAGPAVARGKVPLLLHLLAPSGRPVQVTSDLPGFWTRHYPAIRRELCRRYPRHSWPEDPRTAAPPAARK